MRPVIDSWKGKEAAVCEKLDKMRVACVCVCVCARVHSERLRPGATAI